MRLALVAVACLALMGCAGLPSFETGNVTLDAKKGLTAVSAVYVNACGLVKSEHAAGNLKGKAFNDAKKTCDQVDQLLDAADLALAIGKPADAAGGVRAAWILLDKVQAATPEN